MVYAYDNTNNTQLTLLNNGTFQFKTQVATIQGSYRVQNNQFMMQDTAGNLYQYTIQTYTGIQVVLIDANGVAYNFVQGQGQQNQNTNFLAQQVAQSAPLNQTYLPWENRNFRTVLAYKNGHQWTERENQIYVELLQLVLNRRLSIEEINSMRGDFIKEFNEKPTEALKEIEDIAKPLALVFSLHDLQKIAMLREQLSTSMHQMAQQQPAMNNYKFFKILNKDIKILSVDTETNLSLSNQDIDAYISFLQFQTMLSGQNYQLSLQEKTMLQIQLVNEFTHYSMEQKETLAYADFIWNNVEKQWSQLSVSQQQQLIVQTQNQMPNNYNQNAQQVNPQQFWNQQESNIGCTNCVDDSLAQFKTEAASKGMNFDQYMNYKQSEMKTNNYMFQTMQNMLVEDEVLSMNMWNTDPNYDYVVEYN